MPETPEYLSERLKNEGEKTLAFFAGLTPEQWHTEVYTEGEHWTVRSVLAHYLTAERGFIKIYKDILSGGEGASADFDIDRYNASQQAKNKDSSPAELMEQFKQVRAEMTAFVASLTEADLQTEGRHPYLGMTTLAEMVKMIYRHNQIHHRDLRSLSND